MKKNLVCILRDGPYSILLAKDNYKGIDIQVSMLMDVIKPNDQNELVNHRTQVVVYKNYICVQVENKMNDQFEYHLSEGIKIAKQKVAELEGKDVIIDKIMDQYRSANEKLNGTEKADG